MKFNPFGSQKRMAASAPTTGKGERIYAVGDVHGRYDLLRDLLAKVENHNAALPAAQRVFVVLLGDLIDRGEQSADVLRFIQGVQERTEHLIVLKGNHEEMMLRALDREPGVFAAWLRFGGARTLASFGIDPPESEEGYMAAIRALANAIPRETMEWLRKLPLTARSGDYFFCHAGIRPGVQIKRQVPNDLLWIRDDFLKSEVDHGMVVVHGHSVSADVQLRHNRIGIDTGAYRTGILTALYLEGEAREILTAEMRDPARADGDADHGSPAHLDT